MYKRAICVQGLSNFMTFIISVLYFVYIYRWQVGAGQWRRCQQQDCLLYETLSEKTAVFSTHHHQVSHSNVVMCLNLQ